MRYQPEEPLVTDSLPEDLHQDLMLNRPVAVGDIAFDNRTLPVQVSRICCNAVWQPRPFRNPCDRDENDGS